LHPLLERGAAVQENARHGSAPAIAAAVVLMTVLGSLYSWSVFILPLEETLKASRADVSLIFSLATLAFTTGMLVTPLLYPRLAPAHLAMGIAVLAGVGHLLAASLVFELVLLGYGGLFGLANGAGYSIAVQSVQQAGGQRRGRWTGIIVACYALGAAVCAPILERLVSQVGLAATFIAAGGILALAMAIAAALLARSGLAKLGGASLASIGPPQPWPFALLWVAMALGSLAGVFALGHAAGLLAAPDLGRIWASAAVAMVTLGNAVGRVLGGWSGEGSAPQRRVALLQVGAAAAFASMAVLGGPILLLLGLLISGVGYGWMAGALPMIVARYWGIERVGLIYGRLFTAWGCAAVLGPWIGGSLFDLAGDYRDALSAAAVAALGACVSMLLLPEPERGQSTRRT
jgi:MFS transporter, OFA family, oxalate/formate antiporter